MPLLSFSCVCGAGVGNLGTPSCVKNASLLNKDYFVNAFASDGTRNSIKATDLINGKLTEGKILEFLNHADPSKRWYPTPDKYEEVANARTDRQTQESSTGTVKVLRNGVKTRQGELWDVPESWGANINKASCVQMATFSEGEDGGISGEVSADGSELYPLLIEKGTLNAESFDANPDKDAYTVVTYQLSRNINEGAYLTLSADDIEADLGSARGLIEVSIDQDVTPNTATEIFVTAKNCSYGTFGDFENLEGAVITAQWSVKDSLGATISISSVEETATGYKITIASTPSADVVVSYLTGRTSVTEFGYVGGPSTITTGA